MHDTDYIVELLAEVNTEIPGHQDHLKKSVFFN